MNLNSEKSKQAVEVFRKVENNERERQAKKSKCVAKLTELREKEAAQKELLQAAQHDAEAAAGRAVLENLPETELEAKIALREKAATTLAATELMIKALENKLSRIDPDPAKPHPIAAARQRFFTTIYEDARDQLLRSGALEQIRHCFVLRSMVSGQLTPGSSVDWNVFLQTLEIPAPDRAEILRIAVEIEGMLE